MYTYVARYGTKNLFQFSVESAIVIKILATLLIYSLIGKLLQWYTSRDTGYMLLHCYTIYL